MPYQTLRLTGGVNTSETPALNEAGIITSRNVRFKPDPKGAVLVETIGGWEKFYANQITSVVRALLAWEDTNAIKWIAFGTSDPSAAQLTVCPCSQNVSGLTTAISASAITITPQYLSDSSPAIFQTTTGSPTVTTVTDNIVTGLSNTDSVFITTPVSVGGVILFGQYDINTAIANQYTISARNVLGLLAPALYATVASPLAVTAAAIIIGSPNTIIYTYALQPSAPFAVGDNVNVTGVVASGASTAWNGSCIVTACTTTQVTVIAPAASAGTWSSGGLLSNYGVTPIFSVDVSSSIVTVTFPNHGQTAGSTFTILNPVLVGSVSQKGNYIVTSVANSYSFTINASSKSTIAASNYANAMTVSGGSSTTTAVTLQLGQSQTVPPTVTVTGGSSTITDVTLTWPSSTPYTFTVGQSIYVSGISPVTWNGTFTVGSSTATSVTYSLGGSALSWVSGGIIQSPKFNIGAQILISGCSISAWNGVFTVSTSTPTSVTYALSGSALSWTGGGSVSDIGGDVDYVYSISTGSPVSSSGYGTTTYGAVGYGMGSVPAQTPGNAVFASNWSLDNWGEILLASPVGFTPISDTSGSNLSYSPIYSWSPTIQQSQAVAISNGPPASTGFFVAMPQRQIVAWGTTFNGVIDPLLVRWCDVSNYNVWVGQITNQAGSYRLSTGSAIIGAMQAQQQGLLWTDIGLWSMQYIGPPYVYSFNQVGQGCGLIARRAMGAMNGVVYWMGTRQFYTYSGSGVTPIVCPVWDAVFQQLDQGNVSKITVAVNSQFQEITWYYPVIGGNGECSNYVRFNALTNMWDIGILGRTAWIDNSVLGPPIGYDPVNQYIYQHEISQDADGVAISSYFTTGYFSLSEGQNKIFLDEVWPDFKWGFYNQNPSATVYITFSGVDYPGQTPNNYGPYIITKSTKWFNPRIRERLLAVSVSSFDLGGFWRIGAFRFRASPDGRY